MTFYSVLFRTALFQASSEYTVSDLCYILRSDATVHERLVRIIDESAPDLPRLHSSLRSASNDSFRAALSELLLYRYLKQARLNPDPNPMLADAKTPDFFLPESGVVLEVTSLFLPPSEARRLRNTQVILKALQTIQHVVRVNIRPLHVGDHELPSTTLQRMVTQVRAYLDRVEAGELHDEALTVADHGVHFVLRPSAYRHPTPRPLGALVPGAAHWGGVAEKLREEIREKGKRYKQLKAMGHPFVVVLVNGDIWSLNVDTVADALYGRQQLYVSLKGNKQRAVRDNSGFFTPSPKLGKPQNTTVSAVMCVERDASNHVPCLRISLLHNPWAENPVPKGLFPDVRELVPVNRTDASCELQWNESDGMVPLCC